MATAPLTFPSLPSGKGLDSSKMETTRSDPGMRQEMEGGYTVTRARTTRAPRRIFKCGMTMITQEDKETLEEFWDSTRGTSLSFSWDCPFDDKTYIVRFKGPMVFPYAGVGGNHHWNCSFELEQV